MALGVPGVAVGCWTHPEHPTGCTVVLPPEGTVGGASVRGGAPGTREMAALSPTGSVQVCHAVLLTGGSAFGLAAAHGVMEWCEARGRGFQTPLATVPIVGAAVVFDIRSSGQPRPGPDAGRAACEAASEDDPPEGSVGVGAGCTSGKLAGREWATKGGQGWAVRAAGGVTVGAIMAANPVGEVVDDDGAVLAGTRAPAHAPRFPASSLAEVHAWGAEAASATNTVIGCVVTDAALTKAEACRVADLAHGGTVLAVRPAHTSADGDTMFALATGAVDAGARALDLVVALAVEAVASAIRSAVRNATPIAGAPADPRARR
jgi:L-aminopeptidase/D-esterase-like protein